MNSSWTWDHIRRLWWRFSLPKRVYPPCNTAGLQRLPLDRKLKRLYLLSIAQFRPEKNHLLQLQAFAMARAKATSLPNTAGMHAGKRGVLNAVPSKCALLHLKSGLSCQAVPAPLCLLKH